MPHLSPMSWLLAPFLFLMLAVPAMMSFLWWSQSPVFPVISLQSSSQSFNKWNWS
uniref:ATP synthase F0 subunit 8 n=1 Tax=Loimia medusa TaxID=167822 RepID=UPI0031F39CBC